MVEELLRTGKENAITSKELVNALGFSSDRELRAVIARERKAGSVILSTTKDGGGYYLPSSREEVSEFVRTLENRAKNTFVALRSARTYLSETPGQESFSEEMQDGGLEAKH